MRGYSQLWEVAAKGLDLQFIAGDSAYENSMAVHLLVGNNSADVVGSIPLMQACNDVC